MDIFSAGILYMFIIWNPDMKRILFGIGVFLVCGFAYAIRSPQGHVNLDAFSWSLDDEYVTINKASASIVDNPDISICSDENAANVSVDTCGIALVVFDSQAGDYKYVLASGVGYQFTARVAENTINSLGNTKVPLSSLRIYPGRKIRTACIYVYKRREFDGVGAMTGACPRTGILPVPQPVKCNVSISNNTMDFGEISASKFSSAGVGNTPDGVLAQTREVSIKCDNNSDAGNLKLLLKTSKAVGNYVQSSNQDIGFSVKDSMGSVIVPNNSTQGISVSMVEGNTATVNISAAPVSISGAKPATGVFTATATLEIENE